MFEKLCCSGGKPVAPRPGTVDPADGIVSPEHCIAMEELAGHLSGKLA